MLFRGEYDFLSNMYPCRVSVDINGKAYDFRCAEAAFQAYKCPERVHEFENMSGKEAKAAGRRVPLRGDWNEIRDDVMLDVVKAKFSDPVLADKLKRVDGEICEDNTWNDTYWGRCNGRGANKLGQILMQVRDEITPHKGTPAIKRADDYDFDEFGF